MVQCNLSTSPIYLCISLWQSIFTVIQWWSNLWIIHWNIPTQNMCTVLDTNNNNKLTNDCFQNGKLGLLLKCANTGELAKSFSISLLAVILPESNSEFSVRIQYIDVGFSRYRSLQIYNRKKCYHAPISVLWSRRIIKWLHQLLPGSSGHGTEGSGSQVVGLCKN